MPLLLGSVCLPFVICPSSALLILASHVTVLFASPFSSYRTILEPINFVLLYSTFIPLRHTLKQQPKRPKKANKHSDEFIINPQPISLASSPFHACPCRCTSQLFPYVLYTSFSSITSNKKQKFRASEESQQLLTCFAIDIVRRIIESIPLNRKMVLFFFFFFFFFSFLSFFPFLFPFPFYFSFET
ncbi:uncharacterized protein IWZ02DRAFT_84477 [Phyllosticta citriasiana]|uniref:uncharacterized protein n=1 Tax=Phyllosticta citriasiana TaxID=595635 RepID=UPI0030FDCF52